jgi:biopolymer transport protein ExbD
MLGQKTIALGNLKKSLATYAAESKPPVFRIRMDAKATAQQFISVMDALKQNGLSKVTFDTQTSS